ncbi:TniQ family protein [Nitrogeniibacter mangrovi]|uniref:TniQ family protein n=1 Tax=Nitrogeniibacter mangrovi TaxID=2016596 RepID=A0A6C1B6K0_9RHOO|nr:TniQ family protein [Nitrogeniibacter mangrovi]
MANRLKPSRIDPWPYPVRLEEDELLSSYLVRSAHAHGTTAYRFMSLHFPGRPVWSRDVDRTVDRGWLRQVSEASGTPIDALEGSTLVPFRQIVGSVGQGGDTPLLLSVSVFNRVRRRHGLQFCPTCLKEGRHWFRKRWRLGFYVRCEIHEVPLEDCCPVCTSPIAPHRGNRLDLIFCSECGASLTRHQDPCPIPGSVQALQEELLAAVQGATTPLVKPHRSDERLETVRRLLSILTPFRRHATIRNALGLGEPSHPRERRSQFEHARIAERILMLETVAAIKNKWPGNFLVAAHAGGLTQQTFRRMHLPPQILEGVSLLPLGHRRQRRNVPKIFDRSLQSLARRSPDLYRQIRAQRLIAEVGWA